MPRPKARPKDIKHHPPATGVPSPTPSPSPSPCAEDENRDGELTNSELQLGSGLGEEKEEEKEEGAMPVNDEEEDDGDPNNHDHCVESSSSLLHHHQRPAQGQGLGQACRGVQPQRGRGRYVYEADDEGSVDGHNDGDNNGDDEGDDGDGALDYTTSTIHHNLLYSSISPSAAHIHPTTAIAAGQGLAQEPGLAQGLGLADIPPAVVTPPPPLLPPLQPSTSPCPTGKKRSAPGQGLGLEPGVRAFVHPSPFARHVF